MGLKIEEQVTVSTDDVAGNIEAQRPWETSQWAVAAAFVLKVVAKLATIALVVVGVIGVIFVCVFGRGFSGGKQRKSSRYKPPGTGWD